MDAMSKPDAATPTGFKAPYHHVRQVPLALFLLCVLLILPGGVLSAKPPNTGGGKPPPAAQILPVSLGVPAGCNSTEGTALNNDALPADLIVTAFTFCPGPDFQRPYVWQSGSWHDLGGLEGVTNKGVATGVSDDGTVVGVLQSSSSIAFVVSANVMKALPLLDGMASGDAGGISADGSHIYGNNHGSAYPAVRWSQGVSGWIVEQIGNGQPTGSSDDGSVLVGWNEDAWVWMEGGDPPPQSLGSNLEANDISPAGDLIVGFRWAECAPECQHPIPVYWTPGATGWVQTELLTLDGGDSEARGVGLVGPDTGNPKLVIVGYSRTTKDGIQRAVAWLPLATGGYGAPIRLAALGGNSRYWASAEDVNANGVVVGTSRAGSLSRAAVLWTLSPTQ